MALPSPHQQNPDCDMWAHEYFPPSWFCLPGSRSVLTVVRPGDSARDTLEGVCKVRPRSLPRWRPGGGPLGPGRAGGLPGCGASCSGPSPREASFQRLLWAV